MRTRGKARRDKHKESDANPTTTQRAVNEPTRSQPQDLQKEVLQLLPVIVAEVRKQLSATQTAPNNSHEQLAASTEESVYDHEPQPDLPVELSSPQAVSSQQLRVIGTTHATGSAAGSQHPDEISLSHVPGPSHSVLPQQMQTGINATMYNAATAHQTDLAQANLPVPPQLTTNHRHITGGLQDFNQAIQSLRTGETSDTMGSCENSLGFTPLHLPLGLYVPDKIREKVITNQYIPFNQLLQKNIDQTLILNVTNSQNGPTFLLSSMQNDRG